jgi:hypothetical protein
MDRSTLDEGEPYGDCLTHAGGHYERWENWRALGAEGLRAIGFPDRIASTEYDEEPTIPGEPPGFWINHEDANFGSIRFP